MKNNIENIISNINDLLAYYDSFSNGEESFFVPVEISEAKALREAVKTLNALKTMIDTLEV